MYKNKRVNAITSKVVKFLLGASGFLLLGSGILLGTQANSDPGLVLHYDFEDASNLGKDVGTKANHATNNWVTQVEGRIGKAGRFDTGQFLRLAHNASLDMDAISISVWVKPEARFSMGYWNYKFMNILSKWNNPEGAAFRDYNLYLAAQDDEQKISFIHFSSSIFGWNHSTLTSRAPVDQWNHVVVTIGNGRMITYRNGVMVENKEASDGIANRSYPLLIGKADTQFLGTMDELKIRNYALTPEQVQAEYDRAPKQELVLHYDFEDATNLGKDRSGKTNDATNHGVTQVEGKVGKAGSFSGTEYLSAVHNASLNFDDFTLSFWSKLENPSSSYACVICKQGEDRDFNFYFWKNRNTNVRSYLHLSSTQRVGYVREVPMNLSDGSWRHITLTVKGNKSIGYVDGVKQFEAWIRPGNFHKSYPLQIGKGDNTFKGLLDEVKIWNYALTDQEVKSEYDTTNVSQSSAELVLHYDFEDASNLGKDVGTKANHATNNGVTQVEGRIGKAGRFDTGQFLRLAHNASLDVNTVTLSAWIKPWTFDAKNRWMMNIINKQQDGAPGYLQRDYNLYIFAEQNEQKIKGIHFSSLPFGGEWVHFSPRLNPNQWYHVAISIDNNELVTYRNGQEVKRSPIQTTTPRAANRPFALQVGKADNQFKGDIDEVKVRNYALTPDEIKAEYDRASQQELVLHYDFEDADNLGKDSSGKGNHGTNHNTTQTEGRVGKAWNFNGTSSYLTVPMNQSLKFPVQHSIGAWVKLNRAPQFDTAIIASWVGAYYMSICQDTNAFCTLWYEKLPIEGYKSTDQVMPLDTWVYLTTVWGDRTLDMYINGQKVKSFPTNLYGRNHSGIDKLLIAGGETWNGLNRFLDGQIDELKIWNYALTPEQVQAEYDAAPALPDTQELVLHYDFEDANDLGKDNSGKGNHATNHGVGQVEGRIGKSASFDEQGYLELPHNTSLNFSAFTTSLWFKAPNNWKEQGTLFEYKTLLHKQDPNNAANRDFALSLINKGRKTWSQARNVTEGLRIQGTFPWAKTQLFTPELPAESWHHLAVSMQDGERRIFLDGQEINVSSELDQYGANGNYPLIIGKAASSQSSYTKFVGEIDDLKIWNYARSAEEIRAEYQDRSQPTLLITMKSEQGELIGTQKLTQASNGQAFQIGSSYQITAPQLASPQLQARYTVAEPNQHTVHFSAAAPFQEVTFVYSKPELVLHYTFDEEVSQTIVDHSGKGNHGRVEHTAPVFPDQINVSNPKWDDWGRVGGMVENMLISASKPLEIGQSPAFTMMGWVKSSKTEGQDYIISNALGANGYRFGIRNGKVGFLLGQAAPAGERWEDNYDEPECSTTLVSDGQWHHIVGVFKPLEKKVECYVDGRLDGTVTLRKVYTVRQDSAPYVGKPRFGDAQVDDIRVYNYALTAQKVRELYQSYPAALADPAFQLDLHLSQTGNIIVHSDIVTTSKVHLYRPTKNLELRLTFPNEYVIKSHAFPEIDGQHPISGDIIKSRGLTGTTWTIPLKDNLNGIVNASFVGVFDRQTNHLAQPLFEAQLYKKAHQIAQESVVTSIWNPTRFLLWTDERKPGNGYDIEYIFTRHKESIPTPGGTEWRYSHTMGQGIFNLNGYIPLPAKARFVRSSDSGVSYDAQKHALKISNWNFYDIVWNNKISIFIRYEGLQVGETVSAANGYGTGHLGSPTWPETTFGFAWPSATVEAENLQLSAGFHQPQGTVIPDHPNQHLMRVVLSNHGTTIARNLEYEVRLPDGLQAYEVRLPRSSESDHNGGLTKLTQPVGFRYETNRGKTGTVPPTYGIYHNRTTLGLAADEYFTKLIFTIAEMIPYDRIHGMQGHKHVGLQINGDIAAQYADGRSIQHGDLLAVRGILRGDGFTPREGEQSLTVSGRSLAPIAHWMYIDKASFTQGEKVKVNGTVGVHGWWRYNNGHYLQNPSFFIFVPNGLRFDPKSFRATFPQGGSFSEPRRVPHSLTAQAPADHSLWRVDTQTIIDRRDPAIVYNFELDIPWDAIPGHYTMRGKVLLGSNDPKFWVRGSWGVGHHEDSYNLWNQTARPQIVYDAYHNHEFRIVANDFGTNNCVKADKDGQCKSSFDAEVLSSWSNYSSGQTGDFTVKLYNGGWAAANNILYTIQLPRRGAASSPDLPKNEWELSLYKAVETSNLPAGAGLEYSVNGIDFHPQYRADAKVIRLSIPTLAAGLSPAQLPQLKLTLQAPTFPDEEAYKRAWIRTSYRFNNSAGEYEALVAGLRTVPTAYTPSDDEKYAFCQLGSIRAENANIPVEQCKALLDLYRETGAKSRKKKLGWEFAAGLIKNFPPESRKICNWHGITCNNGKITAINLEGNNLQGQIPASFKALTDLTSLNLAKNQITGFDRAALQPLTQLKTLNLSETKVTSFAELPSNLTRLELNKLEVPAKTDLPQLSQLQHLNMSETTWDMHDAQSLQGLVDKFQNLQEWMMTGVQLQGDTLFSFPQRIWNLTQLRVLNWKGSKILGKIPASLNDLSKLEYFDVSENYLTDPLPTFDWTALSKLKTFNIRNNYIGGLNTRANPLTNKWQKFKPREQWQLIITQGGQRKTAINDLKPTDQVGVVIKQAKRKDAITLQDDSANVPVALYPHLQYEELSNGVLEVAGEAPSYTLSFANAVPQKALWKVGIKNHMNSLGMSAQLELNPSQEALDEEERNRRKQQDTAGNGRNLQFDLAGAYLDKSFSAVHFNVGGDDFGGGIFWQRSEDLTEPVILDYNGTNLACLTQLKGFYYNSQRGERLWPLDQTSLEKLQATYQNKYANWKIKGGWYTDCYPQGQQNDLDQYKTAIYGVIQHLEGNDLRYTLLAGASYDPRNEKMTPNAKCNLQMLNNAYPFGYLYDTAGGIATLGVRINSEQIKTNYPTVNQFHTNFLHELNNGACVNQYFDHDGDELSAKSNIGNFTPPPWFFSLGVGDAREILFKLGILGVIGLSDELSAEDKSSVEGNSAVPSLLLTTDTSIASVINLATKKADELCRNKWIDWSSGQQSDGAVVCIEGNTPVTLSRDQYAGKTIIVKNTDLILSEYMTNNNDKPTTIFVSKGNLFLPAETHRDVLKAFSPNGYLLPSGWWETSSRANYLKGNFIVNGLILGKDDANPDNYEIKNKLIVHGKMASYNVISTPKNQKILTAKRETLDRILGKEKVEKYFSYIGLDKVFSWECDPTSGKGSDETACKGEQEAFMTDKAFGLIDMTFLSPLFL